jgi:hypothetical protein
MDYTRLFKLEKPLFHVTTLDDSKLADLYLELRDTYPQAAVRLLRGNKSRDLIAFFDEAAAVLQFPYYFGYNWNAFDECINSLWINATAYVLIISAAPALFADDFPADNLQRLGQVVEDYYNLRRDLGGPQVYKPLHLILQCPGPDKTAFRRLLKAAGIDADTLD